MVNAKQNPQKGRTYLKHLQVKAVCRFASAGLLFVCPLSVLQALKDSVFVKISLKLNNLFYTVR